MPTSGDLRIKEIFLWVFRARDASPNTREMFSAYAEEEEDQNITTKSCHVGNNLYERIEFKSFAKIEFPFVYGYIFLLTNTFICP